MKTGLLSGLAEARLGSLWPPPPSSVPAGLHAQSCYVSRALMPLAAWHTLDPRDTFWAGPGAPPAWPCLGLQDRGPEAPWRRCPAPSTGLTPRLPGRPCLAQVGFGCGCPVKASLTLALHLPRGCC